MQKISACEEKVMLVIWQANKLLSYKEIQVRSCITIEFLCL